MIVEVQVPIDGSRAAIWAAITDIEHAADLIGGIEQIEVVERPAKGLVGLRWKETRMFFGKPAAVEKRITEAVVNEYYETRAEDEGCVYLSTVRISGSDGALTLTSTHDSQARGFGGRLVMGAMGFLFKGVARKALRKDLEDVKAAVEREGSQPARRPLP